MAGKFSTTSKLERWAGRPLAGALALLLLVMVNYLASRHYTRFDWTRHKLFSLSQRSREVVRSLRAPMDLYVLLGEREGLYSDVIELAERYAAENPLLHVHAIDPDRQRDRLATLREKLGLKSGRAENTDNLAIVVMRDEQHWEVDRSSLAGLDPDSLNTPNATPQAQVTVERAITEAILRVDRNDRTDVCVAKGHDELSLNESQPDAAGLGALSDELSHLNVDMRAIDLRGTLPVPATCDVLIIAGPRVPYAQSESDSVVRYVKAGGNLLLMADPLVIDKKHVPTGLEPVAALAGIELTNSIVIEPDPAHRQSDALPILFFASDLTDHPIARYFRGDEARVLVSRSRALRRLLSVNVVPESVVRTTQLAWGETRTLDAIENGGLARGLEDIAGPIDVIMAGQVPDVAPRKRSDGTESSAGRMVVVGFSEMASNPYFLPEMRVNVLDAHLTIASLGWLAHRSELVDVPARPALPTALLITMQDMRYVKIYSLLLVPLAAMLVGIAVWRSRRAT